MSALKERASSAILGQYQLNTKVNAMRQWLRVTWLVLAFMGALSHTYLHAQTEPKNAGIVLLHGKWGAPHGNIKSLADALKAHGYEVTTPFMPWSTKRGYDAPYPVAINELDDIVLKLRAKGLQRVYVMGTSFGANGSVAHAAYGKQAIDGVIAIAPGHTIELPSTSQLYKKSLATAANMVKDGKGEELETFTDFNSGKRRDIAMKASVFVSYFDPNGWASMSLSAKNVSQKIPLLVLIGGPHDLTAQLGKAYFFSSWPQHPKSAYAILEGAEHFTAPEFAIAPVLKWLSEAQN